jgi:hypothetical protein
MCKWGVAPAKKKKPQKFNTSRKKKERKKWKR